MNKYEAIVMIFPVIDGLLTAKGLSEGYSEANPVLLSFLGYGWIPAILAVVLWLSICYYVMKSIKGDWKELWMASLMTMHGFGALSWIMLPYNNIFWAFFGNWVSFIVITGVILPVFCLAVAHLAAKQKFGIPF